MTIPQLPINEHISFDEGDNSVNETILTSISDRNSRLILQTKKPFNIKVNASCLMLLQKSNDGHTKPSYNQSYFITSIRYNQSVNMFFFSIKTLQLKKIIDNRTSPISICAVLKMSELLQCQSRQSSQS